MYAKAFPKEKSYISFDGLTYLQSVFVKKRDSFEVFQSPQVAEIRATSASNTSAGSSTK